MTSQTHNAILAVLIGSGAAIVLLVPTAAMQYRRDGRLGPGDLTVLLSAAIYGVAIWSYTLLPTPAAGDFTCKVSQLHLLGSVRPVLHTYAHRSSLSELGLRSLLRDKAFLQLALNVMLFVPFGYFVRRVLGRGFLVATVLGFGVSLLVELTQRSGDWGFYHCAYRTFDVDDLLTNTVGALIGSVGSMLLVRRRAPETLPTTVSLGRRLVGMVCDVLVIGLLGAGIALIFRAYEVGALNRPIDLGPQSVLQWGVPFLLEAGCVLLAGRTIGELVVSTHAVARRPGRTAPARLIKLLTGVGAGIAIVGFDLPHGLILLGAYAALSVIAAVFTREARGLSHSLAGMDLVVSRPGDG